MLETKFRELEEFVRVNHSDEDWSLFYDEALMLLVEEPEKFGERVIVVLNHALYRQFYLLASLSKPFPDLTQTRIPDIINSILQLGERSEKLLMMFCHGFMHKGSFSTLSTWWHKKFEQQTPPVLSEDLFAIGLLEWYLIDARTWKSARSAIDPYLDSLNPNVRACAAGALGRLYVDEIPEHPPIFEVLAEIKERDALRPGVAIPYWLTIRSDFSYRIQQNGEHSDFNELEWLLDLIEKRSGKEPKYFCYDYANLLIRDLAADNPTALNRLHKSNAHELQ